MGKLSHFGRLEFIDGVTIQKTIQCRVFSINDLLTLGKALFEKWIIDFGLVLA